jgi:hypothetical protein
VLRARPHDGGGCARTWGGPTRRRARIARDGFESASTHEAVELPAGVAALHTALAQVDRDNLTHLFFRLEKAWCNVQVWDEVAFGLFWEVFFGAAKLSRTVTPPQRFRHLTIVHNGAELSTENRGRVFRQQSVQLNTERA